MTLDLFVLLWMFVGTSTYAFYCYYKGWPFTLSDLFLGIFSGFLMAFVLTIIVISETLQNAPSIVLIKGRRDR